MHSSRRRLWASVLAFALAGGLLPAHSDAGGTARYWSWGWGLYGMRSQAEPLDNARFDWSYILFGGPDPTNDDTVTRANEILRLNPQHGFVIRVWPTMHLGDCEENRQQASLFHYVYVKGVRERVLAETRRQIALILEHIDKPENVLGATFLEELPENFSSAPFGAPWAQWKRGDPLPWDIQRFHTEITRELGAPFDLQNTRHRAWWAKKYVGVINEIQREMKRSLGSRPVLYYPHPNIPASDEREGPGPQSKPAFFAPFRLREVVGPGHADGLFVYPRTPERSQQQQKLLRTLGALSFSQISLPPGMRILSLDDTVALAREPYDRNLGAFLFPSTGHPEKEHAYADEEYQSSTDLVRRFAWDNRINVDIVEAALSPRVELDYDSRERDREGAFLVRAQVWNRRELSWFAGDYAAARLHDVRLTLQVPPGFQVEGGGARSLGDLAPQNGAAVSFRVHSKAGAEIDGAFVVSATTQGGQRADASSAAMVHRAPEQTQRIARSGTRWLQHARSYDEPMPRAEIVALRGDIDGPILTRAGADRVLFLGRITPSTRLLIGPGARARLLRNDMVSDAEAHFAGLPHDADGSVTLASGYSVYAVSVPRVHTAERYRVRLRGRVSDGGNCLVLARFAGAVGGKSSAVETTVSVSALTPELRTVDSREIEVPPFDDGVAQMALIVYRYEQRGKLHLQEIQGYRSDIPEEGADVSSQLLGTLPALTVSARLWGYYDRSPPVGGNEARVRVRLLSGDAQGVP
jgi:hypothetical protein